MRRRDVQLASWSLDLNRDPIRSPPRPLSLRHEDYEDNFDFTTVFYDCFWDYTGEALILIGPPLANLESELDFTILACPSLVECKVIVRHVFLGSQVIAKPPVGTTGLIIRSGSSEVFIAPQPNLSHLYVEHRTIVTLSRNNELIWIRDWIRFNREYHGCTGVLIYDNNSDAYGVDEIYDYLRPFGDTVQIVVLAWPFKYGVADWRLPLSYGFGDSLYCQTGMLEHARQRFLMQARSVLNTDIDELVLTEGRTSIFELVENSATGLLLLDGTWMENSPQRSNGPLRRPPRHRDFACVSTADQVGCETKWAVVPSRVPPAAQWHVHRIFGMPSSESRQVAALRHFKAINTDWTVDRNRSQDLRTSTETIDPQRLRVDVALQEALAWVFAEKSDPIPTADESPQVRSAYVWRVRAGRLALERRWREAIEAVQAALCLMPEHPGFCLFLARLQEQEENEDVARSLRAEAEALRVRDPWYHLQCGRWLQDEADLLAAQRCFAKAIEIDPKFTSAYHELARNQSQWRYYGQPSKPEEILATCAGLVPDDAVTRALWAKALERKGRLHDALIQAQVAIELDPENPHFHGLYARTLRKIGHLDAAEEAARRGMELDHLSARMQVFGRQSLQGWLDNQWRLPTAPDLPAELAEILMAKSEWQRAEAAARDALFLARIDPDRYIRLSEILAMKGCNEQAAEQLETASWLARQDMRRPTPRDWPMIRRNNHWESRANRLSRVLNASGHAHEAIAALSEALVTVPDSSSLKNNLAALLIDNGDIHAATALLDSAILARPKDPMLRHGLSKALKATNPRQAIESAQAAVELEPDNPSFQEFLIALLFAAERVDEAALALDSALPLNRDHGPLYFHLSRLLQRRQCPEQALSAARRAVALNPRKPYLHEHLVKLLMEAGEDDEAEAALREAFERHADGPGLHFQLSRLLHRQQRLDEAMAACRRAIALDPQKPYWHEHLVKLLMEAREDEEAEAALRGAFDHHRDDAGLHFQLSRLLQRAQRPEEALVAARRAIALDPQKPYWHEHLVRLLIEAGKDDEAEAALREAFDHHRDDAGLHFQLSRLLQRRQRLKDALAAARRAIGRDPQKPYWHEYLVKLLMEAGEDDEAEAALHEAFERHPDDAGLHFQLSRLLQRQQHPEEALAAARRAIALDPQKPYWHEHLVKLLMEAGEDDAAEAALRKAFERHPDDAGLRFRQSRLSQRRQQSTSMTGTSKVMKPSTTAAARQKHGEGEAAARAQEAGVG
jgi:tetratricopeptide (TPR) repeat protein